MLVAALSAPDHPDAKQWQMLLKDAQKLEAVHPRQDHQLQLT